MGFLELRDPPRDEDEAPRAPRCVVCRKPIAPVLARLGSITCHNHRPALRAA